MHLMAMVTSCRWVAGVGGWLHALWSSPVYAPERRVLDVGSGTGVLSFELANNSAFGAIHGVDFSPAYVAHADRINHDTRVRFQIGDACAMEFADEYLHEPI